MIDSMPVDVCCVPSAACHVLGAYLSVEQVVAHAEENRGHSNRREQPGVVLEVHGPAPTRRQREVNTA